MKKFITNCLTIIIGIIILLFLLDFLYTKVYENSFPRNKTQHILGLTEETTFDYVFLGSSRVENFIKPSIIKELTNKKAINLGTQGARLDDMNIFLRLLLDKKVKIERIFVQVDYIYNFESSSVIVRSQALPFINSNTIINSYMKRVDSNYTENYYVPFYKYAKNDYRIGFREFFTSLINKKSKTNFYDGFVAANGTIDNKEDGTASLPLDIAKENKSIREIDSISRSNNIDVTYFISPYCSGLESNNYISKLRKKLPNFHDFSKTIKNDSLFANCGHLNNKGADLFTRILIEKLDL